MSEPISRASIGRTLALVVSLVVLLGTGYIGVHNVIDEWANQETPFQRVVSIGGGLYGVLGLIAGAGLLLRRRWGFHVAVTWAVVTTAVGTSAAIAYSDTNSWIGAGAGAFAVTALATALVVWLAWIGMTGAKTPA